VNHKNGFKKDNRLENLEWMTLAENASHAWKIGLVPILKGENCGKSILKEKQIKDIRDQYALGQTQVGLAKKFGVTQANISAIVKRLTWKHI
jgi:DNA-binding MarR family transcriptional regulator